MEEGQYMEFEKYFNVKTIIPNLKSKSKQEVLTELVKVLEKENKIPGNTNILSAIIERESVDSTGVGNGLAIPHAVVRDVNKIITAIARIPEGVDFVAQDRKPVYLAIMICYPTTQSHIYLNLLASISKVFQKKENLQAVLKLNSAKEIYEKIIELLNKLEEPTKEAPPKKKSIVEEEKPVSTSQSIP